MIKPPHSYNLVLLEDGFKKQKKKRNKNWQDLMKTNWKGTTAGVWFWLLLADLFLEPLGFT